MLIRGGGQGAGASTSAPVAAPVAVPVAILGLDAAALSDIYARHADFVWRNLRRMGVPPASLDDAVQDVFLVVHRRRADFAAHSEIKTWLFGILLRVAQTHRRSLRRRLARLLLLAAPEDLDEMPNPQLAGPLELVERKEASLRLQRLLDQLDDGKRAMMVLVDLEEMTVPEAAESLGLNLNTAYSRLRAARLAFEAAVLKQRRQDGVG